MIEALRTYCEYCAMIGLGCGLVLGAMFGVLMGLLAAIGAPVALVYLVISWTYKALKRFHGRV